MKLLTKAQRLFQIRIARIRENHRVSRSRKEWTTPEKRYVVPGERIKAPPKFNLVRGDGVRVVKFLRAVAHAVLRRRIRVTLNFKDTESFHPAGTILLYAEINRIIGLSELSKPITIKDPFRRRPREVLKQIGIHALTGDVCNVVPQRDDVVFWKSVRGRDQSGDSIGPILEFVADRVNREHAQQVEISGIWPGVSEAVINSVEHAYTAPRNDGFRHFDDTKWWMFTQIRKRTFSAAVCDLGCGYRLSINKTIPEAFRATCSQWFLGENPDSQAIKIAMEYGRTSTNLTNRGKGSRDALSVLTKHGIGELFIMSKTGGVRFNLVRGGKPVVENYDLGIDIKGTIVWWNLPLKEDVQ